MKNPLTFGRRPPAWRRWLPLLMVLPALIAAKAAETNDGLIPVTLNVGFIRTCFLNVNRADAEGAFKALAETVGRKRGYHTTTQTQIYDTKEEIEAAITNGTINLAIVDSWKYLSMDLKGFMKPYFVSSEQGQAGKKYFLLTRRGSGLDSLVSLRGKEITELEMANSNAGKAWLDTLLLENHFGAQTDFFGEVEFVGKPALAVLPVFFGKKTACLVDHFSFDVMSELNPQVGKDLQAIATSEPFAENVICLSDTGWDSEKAKTGLIEILADLQSEPAGRQILTLFKIGPMIPFQEAQLDTVRQLRAKFEQLRKASMP